LVNEILNNIGSFMQPRQQGEDSAVGEYAFIASGFWGYKEDLFDKFKDDRVILSLVIALSAGDEVYAKDQGDLILGIPGTPTGRNIARQQIPIALARLDAKGAIPVLKDKFLHHPDFYLKDNCAYALGFLLQKEERDNFSKTLDKPEFERYKSSFVKGVNDRKDVP
jgi:HEAT repeat protein